MKQTKDDKLIAEKYQSVNESNIHKTLKWEDGVELPFDSVGDPIGYEYLGFANSGIKIPGASDWRRFFVSRSGNMEKIFSPSLKMYYEVDSSG